MKKSRPDISIIVPIYNKEKFLEECLLSLSAQNGVDVEFILVNDGSTDQSYLIIDKFLDDKRFKCFVKENGGAASARNYGIRLAVGRYIAFVDGDDILCPRFSKDFIAEADRSNACIISGNKQSFFDKINFSIGPHYFNESTSLCMIKSGFSSCGRLFSRDLFYNEENLFPEGVWAEDNGFIPYITSKAKIILTTDSIIYGYRSVSDSASASLRCVIDYPKSMLYLMKICNNKELIVYSVFKSISAAVCRVQNKDFKSLLSLSQFLSLSDTKELFSKVRKILSLKDISIFSNIDRVEFILFFLLVNGFVWPAFVIFNLKRTRSLISKFMRANNNK